MKDAFDGTAGEPTAAEANFHPGPVGARAHFHVKRTGTAFHDNIDVDSWPGRVFVEEREFNAIVPSHRAQPRTT